MDRCAQIGRVVRRPPQQRRSLHGGRRTTLALPEAIDLSAEEELASPASAEAGEEEEDGGPAAGQGGMATARL